MSYLPAYSEWTVSNTSQTLLIIGATGSLGKHLVSEALHRGYKVRALARKPERVKSQDGLEVVQGDVLKPKTLTGALKGVSAVLCALGHRNFLFPGQRLSKGTANLMDEMRQHKITRILCVTAMGISDNRFRLGIYYSLFLEPLLLYRYFRDKERQEKLLQESALDYTIVRPAQFIPGRPRKKYKVGKKLGGIVLTALVSRATVASFMLDELEEGKYLRQAICITN